MMKRNTYDLQTYSERGSITIYLLLLLSSIIALSAAFLQASITRVEESRQKAILDLAGRSVLAEYDRSLKDRYGLFGVRLSEDLLKQRISMYADVSYEKEWGDLYQLKGEELQIELSEYKLMNLSILEDQIKEYMKYQAVKKIGEEGVPIPRSTEDGVEQAPGRILRNETISKGLPTGLVGFSPGIHYSLDELASLLLGWDQMTEFVLTDQYLLSKFRHHRSLNSATTFFRNEQEYLLFGYLEDEKNHESYLNTLQWIRTSLNAAYLYRDPEKRRLTMEAASLLTPGPEAVATQAILIGSWAALEARNDRLLLDSGEPVPIWKEEETWAVTLEHVLENRQDDRIVVNHKKTGWYYEDYLHAMLLWKGREEKLMRALDLIQLNLKISADGTFTFQDLYGGFWIRTPGYEAEQRY